MASDEAYTSYFAASATACRPRVAEAAGGADARPAPQQVLKDVEDLVGGPLPAGCAAAASVVPSSSSGSRSTGTGGQCGSGGGAAPALAGPVAGPGDDGAAAPQGGVGVLVGFGEVSGPVAEVGADGGGAGVTEEFDHFRLVRSSSWSASTAAASVRFIVRVWPRTP